MRFNFTLPLFLLSLGLSFSGIKVGFTQRVDNRNCPINYFRNNGNGQYVTVFAPNIAPNSIYYLNALTSGNQGNFTFKWNTPIQYPPVINKSWVTSGSGVTSQNWIFGNNASGSPFNPPGVPEATDVKYTFYNSNLPTAGTVTFELSDPYDGSPVCTCSYPLSNGSSSGGSLVSLAVAPPSGFSFSNTTPAANHGSSGRSVKPVINTGGGNVNFDLQNHPSGVTIDNSTGEVSWNNTIPTGSYNITISASNGILPNASAAMSLTIHSIPVVDTISGITTVAPDSTVALFNSTPDGIWSSSHSNVATVTNTGMVRGVSIGTAQINYTVTNTYGSTSKSTTVTVTQNGVISGGQGGLESQSLGTALAERIFNGNLQNIPAEIKYQATVKLAHTTSSRTGTTNIRNLVPDQQALGNAFTGYITSPTDILSFTNAKDVVSVDYVAGGINRAVAFCTETQNGIYTHTKPVCDRLKGSELLAVDTITSGQFTFLRYHLKPAAGPNEYAVSFSAGFNHTDQQYTLQSEWMTSAYQPLDTMYNFQLWSADMPLLNAMLNNVLQKLALTMSARQTGQVRIPVTYITRAERDLQNQLNLKLVIRNESANTSGTLVIAGKENEHSAATITKSYPISLTPFATSTITLPMQDIAEAEVKLYINGVNEDFIYSNDGIWNLYTTPTTVVSEFEISNDTIQPKQSEFRLFRNVKLKATTSDYVTVYRLVKGGGMAANLSGYSYLKFNANGNGKMRIRLIKKSTVNYSEQYEYLLTLKEQSSSYTIPLTAFTSIASAASPRLNDVMIISFTYEVNSPATSVKSELSNVRFAEMRFDETLPEMKLVVFPNPAGEKLNLAFQSATSEKMDLMLISAATGSLIMKKELQVQKGINNQTIDLTSSCASGLYMVILKSAEKKLVSKIVISK